MGVFVWGVLSGGLCPGDFCLGVFVLSPVSHYFLPYILQQTRVIDHSATIIDYIFTNATDFEALSGNILNQLADHFSQFLILKRLPITHKDAAYYQSDYSNFDKDKFIANFSKIRWNKNEDISIDINEKFSKFYDKVSNCVKNHVPLAKISSRKFSLHAKPWITVRLEHMMAKRDKYLRKFHRTHSLDMEYLYKMFRNKVVSETRKSKNDYYAEYFTKHKTNIKMLWSGIRSIINFKSNVALNISCLSHDSLKVEDSKKMANIFNNVFINTAHNINMKIPRTRKSPLDYLISSKTNYSFFISPVTTEEIKIIISSLKNGKAVGPYSIPVYLLKLISEYIAIPLCDIINDSFLNGTFPDWMKLAKVIPLYKRTPLKFLLTTGQFLYYQSLAK